VALKQKFVVASADFTPQRRLYANDGKALALYTALMNNLTIQTWPEGGALPALLEKWLEQYGDILRNIDAQTATRIRDLRPLFAVSLTRTPEGELLLTKAQEFSGRLTSLDLSGYSATIGQLVCQIPAAELAYWRTAAAYLVE
jgi:hypothetical protein